VTCPTQPSTVFLPTGGVGLENACAAGALECGGLTPPCDRRGPSPYDWRKGGVKPPHSKALRAFAWFPGAEAGMSLLEVLIAVSLLGISFVSIFSGLSAGLRATGRLDLFDRANEFAIQKLNELFLDPSVQANERRSGVTPSGIAWEAATALVDKRPLGGSDTAAQLIRIVLRVSWRTPKGWQTLDLETFKLVIPEPPPPSTSP